MLFFFSSRRRHTRLQGDWSSDVCSSDLSLPGDAVLADALMQAGGPTREARVPGMTIERGGKPILQGDSLQLAFARGLTVDQVGLRDDDRFVVPRLAMHDSERTWRIFGIILATVPAVIYAVTRAY